MDFYVAKHLQPIKMLAHSSIKNMTMFMMPFLWVLCMGEVFQIKASIYPQLFTDNK